MSTSNFDTLIATSKMILTVRQFDRSIDRREIQTVVRGVWLLMKIEDYTITERAIAEIERSATFNQTVIYPA